MTHQAPDTPAEPAPWHASFPAPKSTAVFLPREALLSWFFSGQVPGKYFVLVDLRRVDYEGGTIRGSINLPAQSLFPTIPTLYTLFAAAGVKRVIWYCGSSRGRGSRAAGWFADYIAERGDNRMQSLALDGGIKGWAVAGEEYVQLMDGYQRDVWLAAKNE